VSQEEEISFLFVIVKDYSAATPTIEIGKTDSASTNIIPQEEYLKKAEEEKKQEQETQKQKKLKLGIDKMGEQFDCGICYLIMHQPVSLMPCLHNYCGGCFSDWVKRDQMCPYCKEKIIMIKKNATLHSMIESYLLVNPELRREEGDLKALDEANIFKHDIVSKAKFSQFNSSKLTQIYRLY
jgi:E3 ubiquitin-protein ligase CHFR